MTKIPSLKAREVIKGLENLGFEKVRHKGSHAIFHHPDCRRASIPIHPSEDVSPYFIAGILKHLKINEEEFLKAMGGK